jgi:lipopolysaccharide transport system ATP-binding protein
MSSKTIIEVNGVSKCYEIYSKPRDRLKQYINQGMAKLGRQQVEKYYREFWALKDVSFKIGKGETVGIIGQNGSGKSTLLQLICGTLKPTSGHIQVDGRIAALLELGAGFNPEFTGRENAYLNAAILGIPREAMESRMQDVLDFSELGDFLEQPVKTYSSGMYARLAFAVAIHVDPEILIVDEALAVGDARFIAKCMRRIKDIQAQGSSILFVSHDVGSVRGS